MEVCNAVEHKRKRQFIVTILLSVRVHGFASRLCAKITHKPIVPPPSVRVHGFASRLCAYPYRFCASGGLLRIFLKVFTERFARLTDILLRCLRRFRENPLSPIYSAKYCLIFTTFEIYFLVFY